MTNTKMLRGNVTIWAAYPEAFANLEAPTAAELNNTALVKNISCAIEDSYTLNTTSSDTDDSLSICDIGNVSTPTFINYEASLDGFRDEDIAANGVYNLFFNLFKVPGIPYVLIKRIGKPNTAPAAIGDTVSLYAVTTDNPAELLDDASMIRLGARFKTVGGVNANWKLVA